MTRRQLAVLGPTEVSVDGRTVGLRPRELAVLAVLGRYHPDVVTRPVFEATLWPAGAPGSARQALQNHVSRVRRRLGDDAVATVGNGYRLGAGWVLDTERFAADVAGAVQARLDGDPARAALFLRQALARPRGEAFAGLPDTADVRAARARWHEARLAAEEDLVLALLAAGDTAAAAAQAATQAAAEPFREARWLLLALAEYRAGRRRDSLLTLQRARATLAEIAGLDPGPALAALEALVLDDDPVLTGATPESLIGRRPAPRLDGDARARVFVGRSRELAAVAGVLAEAARTRTPRAVELVGAPGIGTSSLAERLAARATVDGWHVATARCHPGGTRLFEPLGELVRQLVAYAPDPADAIEAARLDDLAVLWRARPPGSAHGDLGEAVVETIVAHAERAPTLLIVDDAEHLSDTPRRLLARLHDHDVALVIVTVRADGTAAPADERPGRVTLRLAGLSVDDTRQLAEAVAGRPVSPDLAARLHALTAGHPLLVRHAATGLPRLADHAAVGPILRAAVERLSPAARALVATLAVAGAPTSPDVLAGASDLDGDTARAALDEAAAAGLVRTAAGPLVDLATGSLRQALLDGLDEAARFDLHERLGTAIVDRGGDALDAAPHLLAAAARDPRRAIEAAADAAVLAGRASLHVEAAALLGQAAGLADEHVGRADPTTLRLRLARAEQLRRAGGRDYLGDVWDVLHTAESAGDHDTAALAATALCRLGPLIEAGTLDDEVAEAVERALERCRTPTIRAQAAAQATLFYSMTGRVDRCRAHFDEALEHARRAGDPTTLLEALGAVYISLTHPDDWPLRADLAGEMLGLAERCGDDDQRFEALHLIFSTQVQFADPLLRTTFAAQRALAETLRSAGRRWMVGYQAACLAHLDGRLDDALAIGAAALETAPVARSRALTAYWMNLLVVRLAQGRGQELAAEVDAIVNAQPGLPGWRAVAAWLAALRGDHDRVGAECDRLADGAALPRDTSWSGAAMLLGRAVARSGDASRVAALRALLAPHTSLVTWIGSCTVGPFDLALAELALAAGDRAGAGVHLERARRAVERLRAPVFEPDLDRVAAALGRTA